ncbi:MAG: RIP metalloprotease RseP [Gammaproteobacteria bacterium]|nr:RIP metalloprotease RseP [Gammaproteobacteria bacterium]
MEGLIYSVAGFLVAIAILVAVHEFGHYWVARRLGVKVLKFSIGFGKSILNWRRPGDPTEYSIGIVPLGGYVKMLDEREDEIPEEERDQEFNNKPLAVRTAIVYAGPAFNFLFAIVAIWMVFMIGSRDYEPVVGQVLEQSPAQEAGFQSGDRLIEIDGRAVRTWGQHQLYLLHRAMQGRRIVFSVEHPEHGIRDLELDFGHFDQRRLVGQPLTSVIGIGPPVPPARVSGLVAGKPAERAGLETGDFITAIYGEPVRDWLDMATKVSESPGEELVFSVRRGDTEFDVTIIPETVDVNGSSRGRIGVYRPEPEGRTLRFGPFESLWRSVDHNYLMTVVTLRSIGRMLMAQMSTDNLSGPITIARIAGRTAETGIAEFLAFLAIISISLGLLNLLPIPVLDGGHLMYFLYEGITGRKPSEDALIAGQKIGISAIILLTILAFYNDIMRLF